ncbi:MAG TPA: putative sulfate exporter family transporter, partial [Alphaproteobacteria bacterium]|nr:putative sulfate exporter family transporter [Alphaproteobacteria bacterium]
ATESVIKAPPHKSMVAVATVVLFGTIAMFLYPALYRAGMVPVDAHDMGVFIGASVHEVAHVVAAGNAVGPDASNTAVIIKMIRVLFLAPFLIAIGAWIAMSATDNKSEDGEKPKHKILIPWFAVMFIAVAGFNSFHLLPEQAVSTINTLDTFALTMAMSALGLETHMGKFKGMGLKPVYLAAILSLWLIFGGFAVTKICLSVF